jgi:uncharacterized phage-associated protein
MPFPAKCIANEFLKIAKEKGDALTPMKLQKLVYFAHGWYLALTGQPLTSERIEAWKYGPVIPALYHEFKIFGTDPITSSATAFELVGGKAAFKITNLDECGADQEEIDKVKSLIARVYDVYGQFSAVRLSNSTHMLGTPWQQVYREGVKQLAIPDEIIKRYFQGLATPSHEPR